MSDARIGIFKTQNPTNTNIATNTNKAAATGTESTKKNHVNFFVCESEICGALNLIHKA